MHECSAAFPPQVRVERCKPLLGTYVHIRVEGLGAELANEAITQAFAEISTVHALMSFHDSASDVSRINRHAHYDAVSVDARTSSVLRAALDIAARSGGAFDPCVGQTLVGRAILPEPAASTGVNGDWRSIELMSGDQVRFHCPTWIDLGGIAKGYAVDRAIEILARYEPDQACVNAGGDLRVLGSRPELTVLDTQEDEVKLSAVELREESMASSRGAMLAQHRYDMKAPHVATGAGREGGMTFVSVIAPICMHADALTKVVMGLGEAAEPCLRTLHAHALLHRDGRWHEIGERS
jgi:thiamine biosynthesis lipoprotein